MKILGKLVVLFLIFFFASSPKAMSKQVFLIGEDVIVQPNLVLAVNQIQRKPYSSGLSLQAKQDLIEIQITLANTGQEDIDCNPINDFAVKIDNSYPAICEKGLEGLNKQFIIHHGTESRGSLWFKVKATDNAKAPQLIYKPREDLAIIFCDERLSRKFEISKAGALDFDEGLKLSQFLIEADRPKEAKAVLDKYLPAYSNHSGVILQLTTIARLQNDTVKAAELLSHLSPQNNLGLEDSLTLARRAYELDQFGLCIQILDPLAQQGALKNQDLLFLARGLYFDKQYDRAQELLKDLDARGFEDKTLFFTLGNIYDKKKDTDEAIRWWEKTLSVDPNYFEALFNIGVGYYKKGDKELAKDCWERVLQLDPDSQTREATEEALKSIFP